MKKNYKVIVDILMTILIVLLMAYHITGQLFHEVSGTVMIVLFITHNILNRKWYKSLLKGKYNVVRIYTVIINISLLIVVLLLAYSGITMSRYVFKFLPFRASAATARLIHLCASQWGYFLISLHLGNHWTIIWSKIKNKISGNAGNQISSNATIIILQVAAILFALYGMICFISEDIIKYMFLQNKFMIFDTTTPAAVFFVNRIAIMGFGIFIGYYISHFCQKIVNPKSKLSNHKMTDADSKIGTNKENEIVMSDNASENKNNMKNNYIKNNMKNNNKRKKNIILTIILLIVLAIAYFAFGKSYIRRHFMKNKIEYNKLVKNTSSKINRDDRIVVVYFTRLGNSNFEKDIDAVSSASLAVDGNTLYGNSQLIADMVASLTGTKSYAIKTKDKYPSSYMATVDVAKKEIDKNARPELEMDEIDMSEYDTVVLVYPLWWYKIPMPVATFLEKYELDGKKIYPIVTHGGGGKGSSIEDIKSLTKAKVMNPLEIYDDEVKDSKNKITMYLMNN